MNLQTYLMIKQAGSINDFIENNISRPIYDTFGGTGAYNKAKFMKMDHTPVNVDYAKTNPNINPALAERAKNYKNFRIDDDTAINAIPSGSIKYMPSEYRTNITERVNGSVIPSTNEGAANIIKRENPYYYNGKPIRKPRRMESRKNSIEHYYAGRKMDLDRTERMADSMLAHNGRKSNLMYPVFGAPTIGELVRGTHADAAKARARMDADLARRNQWKQQQQQLRQQRAQQQREQYRAQKRQAMQQQLQNPV